MPSNKLANAIEDVLLDGTDISLEVRQMITARIMDHVENALSQALNIRIREWANTEAGFAAAAALEEEPAKVAASQAAAAALNVCRLSLIDLTNHLTNDV